MNLKFWRKKPKDKWAILDEATLQYARSIKVELPQWYIDARRRQEIEEE